MRSDTFEMRYYNTYYYANIVRNVLGDTLSYVRSIHDLFENDGTLNFCSPFPKYTALHRFAAFCIESLLLEDLSEEQLDCVLESEDRLLPVNRAMNAHGIAHTTLDGWLSENGKAIEDADKDDLHEYFCDLRLEQAYEDFLDQTTEEVFFLMFLNRDVLRLLNHLVSGYVQDIEVEGCEPDVQALFEKDGVLKRHYVPAWAKRAVFFRDRGECVFCGRNLSGLLSLYPQNNYDHIIPLAEGGVNDITNLQLLCEPCNLKKGDRLLGTSNNYQRWFTHDE